MQLNKVYIKDDFKDFLTGFFPDDLKLNEKELVVGNNYKNIKSGLVLGESESLGVKVFYLEHEKERDPRVALTTEAFKILSENWAKKALVVFNSKNSENWRLSLMTISFDINEKNKIVSNLSNPKRKSFFLGPNAKIATASQFLSNKGKVKDFEDLESRFDVEVVTKEFFNNYKKLYTKLLDYLKNDKAFNVFAAKHGLELEIFGKKLLGQIVFIYFLQKKGWLGAKKGDNISNGDKIFLRSLFEKFKKDGENFFNDCLEHLFYSCLNRLPERAGSFYREKFDCQIPFLNGGLFEPVNDYKWQNEFINIPNEIFSNKENDGILDVFDLYNFTIDENTPDDQEISVDPEMLGKVFENLLESNTRKGQGAFYTPREIVHYMCRESLVNYLATNHSNLSEENIRNYINYGDSLNKSIEELGRDWKGESFTPGQFSELNDLLRNIKVVDPACGSGAFLVGMLQEIVRLRTFLQLTPDSELFSSSSNSIKELTVYDLKKETIQNCLYGVDIDPGAIDIAKLRFWLSIVVEENIEDIEPLPNLDYKIMQGNSLLEDLVIGDSVIPLKLEGKKKIDGRTKEKKDLFNESHQAKLFIDESEALVEKLGKYHTEYFHVTDPNKKKILKKKIDGVEDELIQSKCHEEIERADSFIKNNPNDSKKILKYTEKILAIKEVLKKWKIDHLRPFFPWKLHFGEIFSAERGGFDIVIANPPYDVYQGHKKDEIAQLSEFPIYQLAKGGKLNAYKLFLAKSTQLQKEGGIVCEIFQNSFMTDNSAKNIRKEFINNQKVIQIDSFPERDDVKKRVFESAKMSVCILLSIKIVIADYDIELNIWDDKFMKDGKKIVLAKKDLQNLDLDSLIIPLASNVEFLIIKKLVHFPKLKEFARCYQGEINLTVHKKLLCKELGRNSCMIKGAAIQRWHIRSKMSQGEIEYIDSGKYLKENNGAKSQHYLAPRIVMQGITGVDERQRLKSTILNSGIFCAHSVNYILINSDEINNKYLLALLNSKLLNWYFKMLSTNSNVNSYEVNNLPIPQIKVEKQKPIIEIVDKILEITGLEDYMNNSERQVKVKEYEKEIDLIVYELYGLADEEIKIIEGCNG